jgi:hypothetical protein
MNTAQHPTHSTSRKAVTTMTVAVAQAFHDGFNSDLPAGG